MYVFVFYVCSMHTYMYYNIDICIQPYPLGTLQHGLHTICRNMYRNTIHTIYRNVHTLYIYIEMYIHAIYRNVHLPCTEMYIRTIYTNVHTCTRI
jgi:hypothetical protein